MAAWLEGERATPGRAAPCRASRVISDRQSRIKISRGDRQRAELAGSGEQESSKIGQKRRLVRGLCRSPVTRHGKDDAASACVVYWCTSICRAVDGVCESHSAKRYALGQVVGMDRLA